jgi:hypothetical protein
MVALNISKRPQANSANNNSKKRERCTEKVLTISPVKRNKMNVLTYSQLMTIESSLCWEVVKKASKWTMAFLILVIPQAPETTLKTMMLFATFDSADLATKFQEDSKEKFCFDPNWFNKPISEAPCPQENLDMYYLAENPVITRPHAQSAYTYNAEKIEILEKFSDRNTVQPTISNTHHSTILPEVECVITSVYQGNPPRPHTAYVVLKDAQTTTALKFWGSINSVHKMVGKAVMLSNVYVKKGANDQYAAELQCSANFVLWQDRVLKSDSFLESINNGAFSIAHQCTLTHTMCVSTHAEVMQNHKNVRLFELEQQHEQN